MVSRAFEGREQTGLGSLTGPGMPRGSLGDTLRLSARCLTERPLNTHCHMDLPSREGKGMASIPLDMPGLSAVLSGAHPPDRPGRPRPSGKGLGGPSGGGSGGAGSGRGGPGGVGGSGGAGGSGPPFSGEGRTAGQEMATYVFDILQGLIRAARSGPRDDTADLIYLLEMAALEADRLRRLP